MRVVHLNCGTLAPFGGRWVNGEGGLTSRARMVCHCLLVESSAGLVLVDTGIGAKDLGARGSAYERRLRLLGARLIPGEPAVRQLRRLGYDPRDVRHVVLTHLDLDHAGGLADFPLARVHVYADEYAAAMAPRSLSERARYEPRTWEHRPRWVLHRVEGERWFGFDAVRRIQGLPPELLLVPLAGHTRGHCAVAVETSEEWLLHAGDAYFFAGELHPRRPWCTPGLAVFQRLVAEDDTRRVNNQARLRELVEDHGERVRVFCAHDPSEYEALARSPLRRPAASTV
ncbi:MAG: MBL fold metallo-hydrolase [Planctomycetota bacterium]|nr:MAG: MBL fold metallo-hydrolase [Planctomycetota bacterium]